LLTIRITFSSKQVTPSLSLFAKELWQDGMHVAEKQVILAIPVEGEVLVSWSQTLTR
jgi:hypothetical protein